MVFKETLSLQNNDQNKTIPSGNNKLKKTQKLLTKEMDSTTMNFYEQSKCVTEGDR